AGTFGYAQGLPSSKICVSAVTANSGSLSGCNTRCTTRGESLDASAAGGSLPNRGAFHGGAREAVAVDRKLSQIAVSITHFIERSSQGRQDCHRGSRGGRWRSIVRGSK